MYGRADGMPSSLQSVVVCDSRYANLAYIHPSNYNSNGSEIQRVGGRGFEEGTIIE
jgi:hypothetical protein